MLQLEHIRKAYTTDSFTQVALDDVSLAFRDNEFVAILGPSGSGKTTLLNILGGLDHADSGDIVINDISTRDYGDKDWDTYRNHRVGFIFQSYNLIPHQTVLSNVELALTLAGVGRAERKERALAALDEVGLSEHAHKRPAQLSGGQMQRVAIARALVNNPDIVLADEPTGALDTDTGVQVMEILKGVARDRLVVMVTHNPDLAKEYATRIVSVKDGAIVGDTDPVEVVGLEPEDPTIVAALGPRRPGAPEPPEEAARAARAAVRSRRRTRDRSSGEGRHASMSFLTALSLSFNNLMTKKGRTFMTAFAGSIGIIGIAAILSLSNGVNNYIAKTEEDALSSYPLTITKSSFDMTQFLGYGMGADAGSGQSEGGGQEKKDVIPQMSIMTDMFAQVKNNDLKSFKSMLESDSLGISPYINTVQYSYGITPQVYSTDTSNAVTRLNPSKMSQTLSNGISGSSLTGGGGGLTSFSELVDDKRLLESQMQLVKGSWPEATDECVVVLNRRGGLADYTLYALGFYDTSVMDKMVTDALSGKEVSSPDAKRDFTFDDALGMTFSVVPSCNLFQKNDETGTWTDMSKDDEYMRTQIADGIHLKVVGIIRPVEGASTALVREGIAYTPKLTDELIRRASDSQIAKEQLANRDVDVFTGKTFDELKESNGSSFDLSSVFSVDEQALANAFSFDSSALSSADLGAGDFGGLDLGLSGFDASSINFDASAMSSVFNEETMTKIMAGAPAMSLEDLGIGDTISNLPPEQQAAINDSVRKLMASYSAWAMTHPTEAARDDAFQTFMATDEGKAVSAEVSKNLGGTAQEVVQAAMTKYMTEQFAPYFSQQMTQLMGQAGQVMATQLAQQLQQQMAAATGSLGSSFSLDAAAGLSSQMDALSSAMSSGFAFDASAFANAIHFNMSQEDLTSLLTNYMNGAELTYDSNLTKIGYASKDSPESISIYPKDFAAKQSVLDAIDRYNDEQTAQGKNDATIQYSDIAGTLMSSVTDIVNMVSLVLIAFVSISLVVSSIMIGIITYISVLERKKEIGILRAMGASKLNVANVFNAETVIEGFIAGVFAILVVVLLSIPINAVVLSTQNVADIMILPIGSAVALIGVSVLLTFLGGLMPSTRASKNDPVEALRSE